MRSDAAPFRPVALQITGNGHVAPRLLRKLYPLAAFGVLVLACAPSPVWPASAGFLEHALIGHLDQHDIDALNSTVEWS